MAKRWRIMVTVEPGTFSNERLVSFRTGDRIYNLLVDVEDVVETPEGAYLEVYLVDERNGEALIDLPRDTFSSGPRARVKRQQLQPVPA
jgi:hypothetical protein